METNKEDMTFDEWWMVATCWPGSKSIGKSRAKAAWKKGEDPTEYAAFLG